MLGKEKSHAFGKDVYLLGQDKDGIKYWLEGPSWDCEWYWGFGYVETYTNNNYPNKSRDINSHEHIKNNFIGYQKAYNNQPDEYCHNIYHSKRLKETTFNEKEGWELSELFNQFYLLYEMASFCHRKGGSCHIAGTTVFHQDLTKWYKTINEKMIPKITNRILEILSPNSEVTNEN